MCHTIHLHIARATLNRWSLSCWIKSPLYTWPPPITIHAQVFELFDYQPQVWSPCLTLFLLTKRTPNVTLHYSRSTSLAFSFKSRPRLLVDISKCLSKRPSFSRYLNAFTANLNFARCPGIASTRFFLSQILSTPNTFTYQTLAIANVTPGNG